MDGSKLDLVAAFKTEPEAKAWEAGRFLKKTGGEARRM
jgi:hypothetical protein